MGASNVAAVYARWSHLDHAPFRLLAYMALTALDTPREGKPARRYFGGRDALADALGYAVPATVSDDEAQREYARATRNVKKAVGALSRAGAIETVVKPAPGRQGEYALRLDGDTSRSPVSNGNGTTSGDPVTPAPSTEDRETLAPASRPGAGNGATSGDATGLPEVSDGATSGVATGPPQVAPQEPLRNHSGTREDQSGLPHVSPDRARETPDAEQERSEGEERAGSRPRAPECPGCGMYLDPDGTCGNRGCRRHAA
ncbi:hypothetical protein LY13_003864 [Prauserella aidingensis]|nr:hypothetical protein [Prauserella aidingensis]